MRVTGATHGVRELLEAAFATCGSDWQNYGEVDANPSGGSGLPLRRCKKSQAEAALADSTIRRAH